MKRIMVIMLALGLALNADAHTANVKSTSPRARVIVVRPSYFGYAPGFGYRFSPFYNPYYSPFYSPFNDPFYRSGSIERLPSELQLKIDEIENNYSYQLSNARRDKSVSKAERKEKIRELKHQRESAVIAAKRSYAERNKNS